MSRGPVHDFIRNAWEPIAIPRWAITLKYMAFVACGVTSFYSTIQTLDAATPEGYIPVWAACMTLGALLGMLGSIRPKWGPLEAVGASILLVFLVVLTVVVFGRGAIPVGILLIIVTVLPGVRAAFLVVRIALSLIHREEWRL